MRFTLFFLFTLLFFLVWAQFVEDFSDGDLLNNPKWSGDTDRFVVESEKLRLNGPKVSGVSQLHLSSKGLNNGIWEFYINLKFGTSSANYCKVYLMATAQDFTQSLNGYFVWIGNTEDEVSLYKQEGSTHTKIIDGVDKSIVGNEVKVRIKVTRSEQGAWELLRDSEGGNNYVSEGKTTDNSFQMASYFGIMCTYTSTRHNLFFFDDFNVTGTPIEDKIPPQITNFQVLSHQEIALTFSEKVTQKSAENIANYRLDQGVKIVKIEQRNSEQNSLTLTTTPLPANISITLTVQNITDLSDNVMQMKSLPFTYFVFSEAHYRSVQINEFYSDTGEDTTLPEGDFIELFNPTHNVYNLKNWIISDAVNSSSLFPEFILLPQEYVILCHEKWQEAYSQYGKVLGLASFPNFNNSEDEILLQNQKNTQIDHIIYDKNVAQEGVSNEQINPNLTCSSSENFLPSLAKNGGTPGGKNTVIMEIADNFPPKIDNIKILSSDSLAIFFNENINAQSLNITHFQLSENITVKEIYFYKQHPKRVFIKTNKEIKQNVQYEIKVSNITDCARNTQKSDTKTFIRGLKPDKDAVLLSEILFDPKVDGVDFVEIFNSSEDKNYDLNGWKIAQIKNQEVVDIVPFASEGLLLPPQDFLAVTSNPQTLKIHYPLGNENKFIQASIPNFPQKQGTVVLLNEMEEIMQRLDYDAAYHFTFLEDVKGVSLERITYADEGNNPNNWKSASSTVGFATPGKVNSQNIHVIAAPKEIDITPKIFVPNRANAGANFTTIRYQFSQTGLFANVNIYDRFGRKVKNIANGVLLATSGFFRWDGDTDSGKKVRMGHYLVVFEIYSQHTEKRTLKEIVVVGRDF